MLLSYKNRVQAGVTLLLTLHVLPRFYTNPRINSQNDRVRYGVKSFTGPTCQVCITHHGVSWSFLWGKEAATLRRRIKRQRLTPTITLTMCCQSWWKMLMPCWKAILYSSRMVHQHMGRCECKSGLANMARTPLTRIHGCQTAHIKIRCIITCEEQCWRN